MKKFGDFDTYSAEVEYLTDKVETLKDKKNIPWGKITLAVITFAVGVVYSDNDNVVMTVGVILCYFAIAIGYYLLMLMPFIVSLKNASKELEKYNLDNVRLTLPKKKKP